MHEERGREWCRTATPWVYTVTALLPRYKCPLLYNHIQDDNYPRKPLVLYPITPGAEYLHAAFPGPD